MLYNYTNLRRKIYLMAKYKVPIATSGLVVLCTTVHVMCSEGLTSAPLVCKPLGSRGQAQWLEHQGLSVSVR